MLLTVLGSGRAQSLRDDRSETTAEDGRPFYVVAENPVVYGTADSNRRVAELAFRDEVTVVAERSSFYRIRTGEGATGFVRRSALSNVWVRVSKSNGTVYLYRGAELEASLPADFGYNREDDKVRRGSPEEPDHWRTPEGRFLITDKNENGRFYRALVLNYPTAEDAERGYRSGLISRAERAEIVRASMRHETPPMDTELGGWIEIHGEGTGGEVDWTEGCVALQNQHLDWIWEVVSVGTPVVIE